MDASLYQVRTPDGRVWGPLTDEQVRGSIQTGGITPNTLIAPADTEAWLPAWQHPVYGPLVRALPPQPVGAAQPPRREPISTGKILAIVLGSVVLVLGLCSIPVFVAINSGKTALRSVLGESEKPLTLTDAERTAQITLPAGWKRETDLNDVAGIEASGQFSSRFAVVITEPKSDLPNTDAVRYSDLTRPDLVKSLGGDAEGPRRLTVSGYPAVQYRVSGKSDDEEVVMLHTCIETPRRLHQVLLWTRKGQFEASRPELERVLQTFREP